MSNLFGSEILDVAVGMALFFLSVSLICAAIREVIESMLKTRADQLVRGLREMLADPDGQGLVKDLFAHPAIGGLFKGAYNPRWLLMGKGGGSKILPTGNLPSYIPSAQFASALIDMVARGCATATAANVQPQVTGSAVVDIAALRSAAAAFPVEQVRRVMLMAIDTAGDDLTKVKANIEAWFDAGMERVGGFYKRQTQLVLFLVGLGAAAAINLDALTVFDRLSNDKALRAAAVAGAEEAVKKPRPETAAPTAGKATGETDAALPSTQTIKQLGSELVKIGYPIGWSGARPGSNMLSCTVMDWTLPTGGHTSKTWTPGAAPHEYNCGKGHEVVQKWVIAVRAPGHGHANVVTSDTAPAMVLGWLLTALAVTLGAPFWFDLLARFMTIRSTIKPDAEKKPEK